MKKTKARNTEAGESPDSATTEATVKSGDASKPMETGDASEGVEGRAAPGTVEAADTVEGKTRAVETPESIKMLKEKLAGLEDSLLRARADYQNVQRRCAIERSEGIRFANAELMKSLLTVIDDFERSLNAAETSDNVASVIAGIRLVYQNFMKALREQGLESIEALHESFDPSIHEALMQQLSMDFPAGTVVEEIAKGYRLRDRVIRPAKVIVSQPADAEAPEQSEAPG